MNNIYTDKLKTILGTYNTKQKEFQLNIANAHNTLLPAIADTKIKEIAEKQKTTYNQAVESVNILFNELKQRLSFADFPSTEDLSTDRYFFDGTADVDLTMVQVRTFIERYKTNFTMLKLIAKWISREHPTENGKMDEWTTLKNSIPTPKKQLEAYTKIFKSCMSTINSISNGAVSDMLIDDFCKNDNASFWAVIGNGEYLKEHSVTGYRAVKLPVGAGNIFDDITL